MSISPEKPRRGRPPRTFERFAETRDALVRAGMEVFTEQGFSGSGIDTVLRRLEVPKGSFYHYFGSKEEFGRQVMAAYDQYFCNKLDHWLTDPERSPLDRLLDFVNDAKAGMKRHQYTRGCLVGNLGQELGTLPDGYRELLDQILSGWQLKVEACLRGAQQEGLLPESADCEDLAAFFWIGWEGAVLRARLVRGPAPMDTFIRSFLALLVPAAIPSIPSIPKRSRKCSTPS